MQSHWFSHQSHFHEMNQYIFCGSVTVYANLPLIRQLIIGSTNPPNKLVSGRNYYVHCKKLPFCRYSLYIVTTHPFSCLRQQAARESGVMGKRARQRVGALHYVAHQVGSSLYSCSHYTVLPPSNLRRPFAGGSRQYIYIM